MGAKPLTTSFEKAASPPVLAADDYARLLEKLMWEGKGYGKTEPVAAYLLQNIFLVRETEDGDIAEEIPVQPLYVVMDLREYPNEYARSLVMQDIMVQYSRRMTGESDLNATDFKGPGLWTTKKSSFDGDYKRRAGTNDDGKPWNIYEPDTDAYRVCIDVIEPITIPTNWGTPWEIEAGGALAIREKDVVSLAQALADIQTGHKTAEEALLETTPEGETKARFDVYGMAPGFRANNYKEVFLKAATRQTMNAITPDTAPAAPSSHKTKPRNTSPPLHWKG